MKTPLFVLVFAALLCPSLSSDPLPFQHGVNLTGWMQGAPLHQLRLAQFGAQDLSNLRSLGVDGVRLPIDFGEFVGSGPSYVVDPLALSLLDIALDRIEAAGLKVVVDNHGDPTDPRWKYDLSGYLDALWNQISIHLQHRPASVLYEIQNEPHEISSGDWDRVQRRVLATIRKREPLRTVVLTGADWGGIAGLLAQPVYEDPHVVYSFHFYDPMVFTHQGASWTGLTDLTGVAFPPRGTSPPVISDSLKNHWGAKGVRDYYSGDPIQLMTASMDKVAAWGRDHGVSLWCGEFGVYNKNAAPSDRVSWYSTVRQLLDTRKIPWTMWDYRDSFGLYNKGSAEVFEQDLNLPLVAALGFRAPEAQSPGPYRVVSSFWFYRDQGEVAGPPSAWGSSGTLDAFATESAFEGPYFLRLSRPSRYSYVAWTLRPAFDFVAVKEKAAIVFQLRTRSPIFSFDVRFVDSWDPSKGLLPWRKSFTVTQALVPADGNWHTVSIPLQELKESGAWDGAWHTANPGSFDETRVGRFEIVAENSALPDAILDLDEIGISVQP